MTLSTEHDNSSTSSIHQEAMMEKSQATIIDDEKDLATHHTEATSQPQTQSTLQGASKETADIETAPSTPAPFDPRENPDGGLKAWSVVLGAACCLFSSFGWINCIGVFQSHYQTHQLSTYPASTIAWIPSCETFCMFFCGPFIGYFFDCYGPRWILLLGTFLHVFGLMMASLASSYWQILLSQGIVSAVGASCCFYPAMGVMPTWFFRRRGAAFGIMAAGSSTGGVIFPIMVQQLIPKVGFPWTMRICAFLILGLMGVANLTVVSRLQPRPRPFEIGQFLRPLKEGPFLLVIGASFMFFFGMFLPINYVILEAQTFGMSSRLAGYLVPILNGASFFGRVLPGIVADKVGRFNTMVVLDFFTGIVVLALWLPATGNAPIIVFAALYGFGSGAFVSLAPTLVAQISDVREIGVRNGTVFAIISIAALCSNPIGGAIVGAQNGSYTGLQIFCGLCCLLGATGFLGARIVLAGPKITAKV